MSKSTPKSQSRSRAAAIAVFVSILALVGAYVVYAAISLSTSTAYTQNFDTIGTSATATLPADWKADRLGTARTVGTYAGAGTATTQSGGPNLTTSAANGIYNFVSGTVNTGTERAVGFLSSSTTPLGTQSGNLYAQFANNTGNSLSGLTISYDVEKYRNGSNSAGFRIQLFYSTDGTTWTSAGNNFLTTFGANADNSGCSPAPCSTVSVTNQTLSQSIPNGTNFYLAWNYSVASGATTSNAQALGVDNISVLGIAATGPTNPTGVGSASPNSVDQGGTTLLTVAVTPGQNPPSTAHTVTANLSSIGGSAAQTFFDDGTHGDATGGDNIFSFSATVSNGTTPGAKTLPVTIQETSPSNRTGSATIALTVNTPTSPSGVGAASPATVQAGNNSLLTVSVTPGTHPASTGLAVTADLTSIGGSASQQFFDNGTNGDVTAGDNLFSFNATVAAATTAGAKNIPAVITDAQARTGSATITLTVTSATTNPTGSGAANPATVPIGSSTLLTVNVTPGLNPASTSITVSGNLSSIGGSAAQQFFDDGSNGDVAAGDNVFSYSATVGLSTTPGAKTLPFSVNDGQSRSSSGNIALTVTVQTVPPGTIVLSQVYGGGGNAGATLTNDFIEIFNRGQYAVSLNGWSVQYASAGGGAGATWNRRTNLSGVINPGQYFLISEAAGTGGSTPLPPADVSGSIAMGATDGKVALVSNAGDLPNGCPTGNANLVDFIGYGTADCFEGSAAQALTNATAHFRKRSGCQDTDSNASDFVRSAPSPRNSSTPVNVCPASGDFAPSVESTSPANGAPGIDNNTNITVTFDEPVNVTSNWFTISCSVTGIHSGVTTDGPTTFTINPDVDFGSAEQCTVTINHTEVFDQDSVDPPDNMDADYVFTFTTSVVRDPAEHMVMGNPSGAVTDEGTPLNYLMMKPQYALSYNNDKGTPNWTSWHLDNTWTTGVADRQNDFRSDDTLPLTFKHVASGYNFATYGFDRGHMCPSADRTSSINDNSATFLMTNMVPQASGNNQGPWASLENYIRAQLNGANNELYIVSGPAGVGGHSSTGDWTSITDTGGNSVTVPHATWKVVMVLPNQAGNDVARVDNSTRTFAVIMPNDDGIRPDQWQKYLATVRQVESLSGYNFFSNVPQGIQDVIETRLDVVNDTAPVANSTSATTAEDHSKIITLSASDFNVNNVLIFTAATLPQHGSLSAISNATCGNGTCTATVTYTAAADYNGPDSFTFTVNDGALDSITAANVTVNVTEVNDDPVPVNDSKSTPEDTTLNFAASDLSANDSAGPNEAGQSLTVDLVITTPNTHGTVALTAGQITYSPEANFNGAASFDYRVCDNGTTNGVADAKCATATVNVTVAAVNDAPSATDDSITINEDTPTVVDVLSNDSDIDHDPLTVSAVTQGTHGSVTNNGSNVSYSPNANYNGTDSFTYTISDGQGGTATATVHVTIDAVNDNPAAVDDSATTDEDTPVNINVRGNDSDVDNDSLTVSAVTQGAHGTVVNNGTDVTYSPAANYHGADSFSYTISDGHGGTATANVSVTINAVNDAPVANDDAATTDEDASITVSVLGNDSDVDGDSLTVSAVTQGAHGSVTNNGSSVSYAPAANFNGTDSFTYTVSDGHGGTATASVSITISAVNDAPVANDDSATTNEDTSVNVSVLGNDSDVDGDSLTVSAVTQGAHGSVVNNGGSVTYAPAGNYNGADSFTYTVSDGHGGTATANVNVTINAINDNPVATADSATTNEDTSVTIDVVANDTDVDGDALTLTSVGSAAHGSVSIVSGKAVYSPAANYNGVDSFGYVVSDGHGGQASGSVSITVNAVNDPPTAYSQSVATTSNTAVGITLTGNDVETPASLTFNVTAGPSHGTLTGTGANRTYSPAPNYAGPDSFKFTVTDTGDGTAGPETSAEATVSITVGDTVPPVITLNGHSISLWPADKSLHTINVSDLVANASDNFDPNVNLSSVVIASVSSDEGTAASGDIVIAGDCKSVQLRQTRDGDGDGRVYIITFRARDAAGNESFVTAKVTVPHDQGGGAAVESLAAYTVTSTCP